jgi:HD-like signal output (HDOD) protein
MKPSLINWTLNTIDPQLDNFTSPYDMRAGISRLQTLPPMPGIALRIMQLATDPTADAAKLADIIELDPLLAAQVIRWARSPLYAYRRQISSVNEAINRILGFDFVFNLAFGLAILAPLKVPKDGPIGTRLFWTQAMASTRLMPMLSNHMPVEKRIAHTQLFLPALLHNIGYPLLGDQFPKEFSYLNGLILANPTISIINLEKFALGVDHNMLGAWLMRSWGMPKPIIDVVYHHHNPNYRGENSQLSLLTYLNDSLLGTLGIGDAQVQPYSEELLMRLNLSTKSTDQSLDKLNDMLENIVVTAEMIVS